MSCTTFIKIYRQKQGTVHIEAWIMLSVVIVCMCGEWQWFFIHIWIGDEKRFLIKFLTAFSAMSNYIGLFSLSFGEKENIHFARER